MMTRGKGANVANAAKNEEEEVNIDTEKILQAMSDMKAELILNGENKEQAIVSRINEMEGTINNAFQQCNERITGLEQDFEVNLGNVRELQKQQATLIKDNKVLSEKLLDSVCHSRRLNLDFLGFKEDKEEDVMVKLRMFWTEVLKISEDRVKVILIRDAHRIGKFDKKNKYPRVIKVGFVLMEDRNMIYGLAYRCKSTDYSIRVDIPLEYVPIRKQQLEIRKQILEANPTALASCAFRSYKPVLLVKWKNKVQEYNQLMPMNELQEGDKRN